jgi:hypothetical protein
VKGVGENELDGVHRTFLDQDKQPQPRRQKSINMIKGQYEQDLSMMRIFYTNLMEMMMKIYMMMKIFQTKT